jgi:hypothetical protein
VSIRPDDDDPTIADGKVLDGKVIDGEVIDSAIVDAPLSDDELTARLRALSMEIDDSPAELGEQTTATLHALAAEAGDPPADLHEAVLVGAQRMRRRRYAVTGMTALAVLAISGTVVASVSRASDQGTDRLVAAAPHSASPLPTTDSVIAPPALAPSTLAPTPSASVSGAVSVRPTQSSSETQRPRSAPLVVSVSPGRSVVTEGKTVTFTVRWKDGDGRFAGSTAVFEGASTGGGAAAIERCHEVPSPRSGSVSFRHKWNDAGTHKATFTVSTYDCATSTLEQRTVTATVTVEPVPSSPPPTSPSATPSPSSSPATPPPGVG